MKVSIIIPAYNEEDYIEKTLLAVLSQYHPDFEVIVVDNNSTDKTAEKVRKFSGARLIEKKTRGVQGAREEGRLAAAGGIIANLDADCPPSPDWIQKAIRYLMISVSSLYPGRVTITTRIRLFAP